MLSDLRAYRKELAAKNAAKEKAKKSKARDNPRLIAVQFRRHGSRWTEYECSECSHSLHRTAKFCLGCGAWFDEIGRKAFLGEK